MSYECDSKDRSIFMAKPISKVLWIVLAVLAADRLMKAEDAPVAPVKTLLKENRLDEASAICKQYEVLSTRDRDDRFACAWVYLRTNQLDSAQKILDEQKGNAKLADYQLLQGYSLSLQKKYDEAKKVFEAVLESNKGKSAAVSAQELIAEMYESQDKMATAAFLYNLVVKEDPNRGQAVWGLSRFYQGQNDIRRCITYLEQTTKLWPKHIPSRFLLAKIYFAMGPEYSEQGFVWLKDSYRLNRTNPEVLEEIGSFFERKNKIPEAVKYWQKALSIKPDLALSAEKTKEYFNQTVKQLFDSEKYDAVLEKLESNQSLGNTPDMVLLRGQAYRALRKYDDAINQLRTYLRDNPKSAVANRELGIAFINKKLWNLAADAFAKAVVQEPNNGINLGWYAYSLEEKGELVKAKELWEKAITLLDQPEQIERANRKIATIEKRLKKQKAAQNIDE